MFLRVPGVVAAQRGAQASLWQQVVARVVWAEGDEQPPAWEHCVALESA